MHLFSSPTDRSPPQAKILSPIPHSNRIIWSPIQAMVQKAITVI